MPDLKRQHHPEFVALAQNAAPPPKLASAGASPNSSHNRWEVQNGRD
jgi:hypothetical protein